MYAIISTCPHSLHLHVKGLAGGDVLLQGGILLRPLLDLVVEVDDDAIQAIIVRHQTVDSGCVLDVAHLLEGLRCTPQRTQLNLQLVDLLLQL